MTRKDFEKIAEIVAVVGSSDAEVLKTQAEVAGGLLVETNERFDRDRFVRRVLEIRARIMETVGGLV